MPRFIIKLEDQGVDYYMEWSTIVDAPVTYGMPLEEFTEYYKTYHGLRNFEFDFANRMKRVEEKGTSAFNDASVDDTISFNRAGEDEDTLTKEQIIDQYIRNRPDE